MQIYVKHTYICTHTNVRIDKYIHMYIQIYIQINIHIKTHTHTNIQIDKYIHIYTYNIHTNIQNMTKHNIHGNIHT